MKIETLHAAIHRIESLKEKAKKYAHDPEVVQLLHIRIAHYEEAIAEAGSKIVHLTSDEVLNAKMNKSHVDATKHPKGEHQETKGQLW